jgi:acyl phosphate:glycerol-3-phosphate acyltransferase
MRILMNIFVVIVVAVAAYCVGAIPVGYLIARLRGIADIRKHGSGNIGATNVSRVLGLHYFFIIFLIDAGKAFFFMHGIAPYFSVEYLYFFACLLLFGNGCSVFLHGTGGKGVATACGLLYALQAWVMVPLLVAWFIILVLTHTVGIASVGAVLCLPVCAILFYDRAFILFSFCVALWIVWTHRINVRTYFSPLFNR